MNGKGKNYKKKLAEITVFIDNLIGKSYLSEELFEIEEWLIAQLDRIHDFKVNVKPFWSKYELTKDVIRDSVLVFDSDLRILEYSGIFTHFLSPAVRNDGIFSLPDFIDESKHSELFSHIRLTAIHKDQYPFETIFKNNAGYLFRAIVEMKRLLERELMKIVVLNLSFPQSSLGKDSLKYEILKKLSGIGYFFYDQDYRFIMTGGKEKIIEGFDGPDFIGKTLFETDKTVLKRLFPFFNKALNGINNEGEVRLKGNIYYINAIPVKDENGFIIGGVIVAKNTLKDIVAER
jgi:hypothetical protein